jgi:predicted RNA-binding Zn-ribbon protein involved in translation (DUF1610 family)
MLRAAPHWRPEVNKEMGRRNRQDKAGLDACLEDKESGVLISGRTFGRLARDRKLNEVHRHHHRGTRKCLGEMVYFERFVSSRSVPFNQPNSQSDVKERMQRCRNASSACGQAVIFRCDSARNGMHSHARFSFACYPFGVEPLLNAWGKRHRAPLADRSRRRWVHTAKRKMRRAARRRLLDS